MGRDSKRGGAGPSQVIFPVIRRNDGEGVGLAVGVQVHELRSIPAGSEQHLQLDLVDCRFYHLLSDVPLGRGPKCK